MASEASNAAARTCSRPSVRSIPSSARSAMRSASRRTQRYRSIAWPSRRLSAPVRASSSIVSATTADVLPVKRREHQHPEVPVVGAVGVQQTVPQQRPQVREPALAPLESVEVADQDLVVDLGADRPHHRLVQKPRREHRTEAPLVLEEQPERVGDDPPGV